MNLKNLQEKVKLLDSKTKVEYKVESPKEREILAKTVKLNEEVGELCNDILGILKLQRKSKLEKFDKRNIYQEFADVIITTIQLAQTAGVDIERAISDKMKTIEVRLKKEEKKHVHISKDI
ncbi:MAG: MazG-like family protein [Candidatus Levyibacteriota bacterium]